MLRGLRDKARRIHCFALDSEIAMKDSELEEPENPAAPVLAAPLAPSPAALDAPALKQRFPVLTLVTCGICTLVFLELFDEQNPNSWETLAKWGCYPPAKIYGGALWGFITSAFVHVEPWHVAFNLYWLWVFGSRLERVIGSARWLCFFLGAAFVSSGFEFAFTGATGIGASGVAYALFGFMWLTKRRYPSFQKALDPRTILLFLVWLVGCFAATLAKVWTVGNAAHLAGLLFGAGLGACVMWESRRALIGTCLAVMVLVATAPVFWAPWSSDWTSWHAVRAHERRDYISAITWYQRSLSLGQDKTWCWQNMALAYHALNDQSHFQETLQLLRAVDEKTAHEVEVAVGLERKP
jgi:membrane associated rhomboid family serine protease